ncbi:MAG: hypothetical protein NZM25_09675 [Leptospiraceae bacterium]|nr:hypothetical protein [Leptospiraceae bacterium]MDW8306427.1 hypothetical protein [Leptospiraceae bacterium]
MPPFIFLTKLTTTDQGAIIKVFIVGFIILGCHDPQDLPWYFRRPTYSPAEAHSWEANRRYYLLVRFLEAQGYRRCIYYRPQSNCSSYPRLREIRFSGKLQSPSRGLIHKVLVAETGEDKSAYFFNLTGQEGLKTAYTIKHFFSCIKKHGKALEKLPNLLFHEGDEVLSLLRRAYQDKGDFLQYEKNLCPIE